MEWAPVTGALLPSCLQRQGPLFFQDFAVIHIGDNDSWEEESAKSTFPTKLLIRDICLLSLEPLEQKVTAVNILLSLYPAQVNVASPSKFPRGGLRYRRGYPFLHNGSSFQKISSGGFPLHSSHLGSFYIFDTPDDEIHYTVLLNHSYLGTSVHTRKRNEGSFSQIKWEHKPFEMVKFFTLVFLFYVLWVVFFPPFRF